MTPGGVLWIALVRAEGVVFKPSAPDPSYHHFKSSVWEIRSPIADRNELGTSLLGTRPPISLGGASVHYPRPDAGNWRPSVCEYTR